MKVDDADARLRDVFGGDLLPIAGGAHEAASGQRQQGAVDGVLRPAERRPHKVLAHVDAPLAGAADELADLRAHGMLLGVTRVLHRRQRVGRAVANPFDHRAPAGGVGHGEAREQAGQRRVDRLPDHCLQRLGADLRPAAQEDAGVGERGGDEGIEAPALAVAPRQHGATRLDPFVRRSERPRVQALPRGRVAR